MTALFGGLSGDLFATLLASAPPPAAGGAGTPGQLDFSDPIQSGLIAEVFGDETA